MMELIEQAIPVIQALPRVEAACLAATVIDSRSNRPEPVSKPESETCPGGGNCEHRFVEADAVALAAHFEQKLEQLRVSKAQLISGTILQQYQKQAVFPADLSPPPLRVLSVQG